MSECERERGGEFVYVCASVGVCGERERERERDRETDRDGGFPRALRFSRSLELRVTCHLQNFRSAAKSPTNVAVSRLVLNQRPGCLTVCSADRLLRQCFLFCSLLAHDYKAPLKF